MFINFIGINDKIVNLNAIALIEDTSPEDAPSEDARVVLTTLSGDELEFSGDDAIALLDRCEMLISVTDAMTAQAGQAVSNLTQQARNI